MPVELYGIETITANLTLDAMNGAIKMLKPRRVILMLPKFELETEYNLLEILQDFGLISLSNANTDFAGINQHQNLRVSRVIHKAYIQVNEDGDTTTASKDEATDVGPIPFIVDRPFMFLIRDNSNGLILFLGEVKSLAKQFAFGFALG